MRTTYNVEFVFERMVIITTVEVNESVIADESATNFYQKYTDESIIEALENADYEGNSFLLLNLIATALKIKVKFELVSA